MAECPRGSTSIDKNSNAHRIEPGPKSGVLVHSYKCSDDMISLIVTEYDGDIKDKVKTAPPLHRSRTDSIISYCNPGDNLIQLRKPRSLSEAVSSTFYIITVGNIDLSVVLKVSISFILY